MRRKPKLATLLILGIVGSAAASGSALAADDDVAVGQPYPATLDSTKYVQVEVADAYLEMRTGPGRGYPVTRVVPRGERVDILFRRTDWFKVRDDRGHEGWADRRQMLRTLLASGDTLRLEEPGRRDYDADPWEAGALSGNFGGGNVNTAYVGYALNEHLSVEVAASQVLGRASNSVLGTVGLVHTFRPDWRIAPFVGLGTGVVSIKPKATIVSVVDRTEQVAFIGGGVKVYLSRRFVFRADYRSYVIFTEREENEERNEWKVGFAFFF